MNDVRTAILKAANSIEKNPDGFDFTSCARPECGTPGCALGWIGLYAEVPTYGSLFIDGVEAVAKFLGVDTSWKFYGRMDSINFGWMEDASICAKNLRAYADKYHPADKPNYTGIPESVRSLFNESVEEQQREVNHG